MDWLVRYQTGPDAIIGGQKTVAFPLARGSSDNAPRARHGERGGVIVRALHGSSASRAEDAMNISAKSNCSRIFNIWIRHVRPPIFPADGLVNRQDLERIGLHPQAVRVSA